MDTDENNSELNDEVLHDESGSVIDFGLLGIDTSPMNLHHEGMRFAIDKQSGKQLIKTVVDDWEEHSGEDGGGRGSSQDEGEYGDSSAQNYTTDPKIYYQTHDNQTNENLSIVISSKPFKHIECGKSTPD